MRMLAPTAALAAIAAGLSGCGDYDKNEAAYDNNAAAYSEGEGNYADAEGNYAGREGNYTGTAPAGTWPEGTRIVVENGVTYRIDPRGARIRLGADDSRIVVENGIRYRVDPGGTRVRIDDEGLQIRLEPDGDVTVNSQ